MGQVTGGLEHRQVGVGSGLGGPVIFPLFIIIIYLPIL